MLSDPYLIIKNEVIVSILNLFWSELFLSVYKIKMPLMNNIVETISFRIGFFFFLIYSQSRNLNCQTVEYKYRGKRMVAPEYCQAVNCRTSEVSRLDCIRYRP